MPTAEKTNAMRVLDRAKVRYQVHNYSSERHSAEEVAALVGVPPEVVFKTLVVILPAGKPLLAIIPGNHELDLKKVASLFGQKKAHMASLSEAEALTGLQVGGISALALMNKGFRVAIHTSATQHEQVLVSAGVRGTNLALEPADLIRVINAQVADLTVI
ncbi:MAG: Cys-tRNA(Pro) deacylase [Chloroflexi bacterium]|nr:Cys-tRNA(Pro) deacylase [Chloroflexota bacterium]